MGAELVLATHNAHKVEELRLILEDALPEVVVGGYDGPEPVEDGVSFADNALIKARAAAEHTGRIALADDSGICVDILGGSPGIFSARWSGTRDDQANVALLLTQLADIRDPHRTAHFTCAIAVVVPGGDGRDPAEHVVTGEWEGRLAGGPAGIGGFGYDPIFVPDGHDGTVAELPAEVKGEQSHRARALKALVPVLRDLL